MKKFLFAIFSTLFIMNCSQEDLHENNIHKNEPQVENNDKLLIEKNIVDLNPQDATNVALLFRSKNKGLDSRTLDDVRKSEVKVHTIMDEDSNIPLLYVVNYGNDKGYVIVSANKKSPPILAFSEKGSYDIDLDIASKEYLQRYKSYIKESYTDTSEKSRKKNALEWALFEKTEDSFVASRGTDVDINQKIQEEIAKKTALGYTYIGKITGLSYYLPADEYETVLLDVSTHSDPKYNYEEVSLFFIKSFNYEQIGPLIGTEWSQYAPFNVEAPNGLAGCVPIAVAQIAYYHKHPTTYNWSQIAPIPILNDALKEFILDVRDYCDVEYKDYGTSSDFDKAYKAFKTLNYTPTKTGLPDFIKLRTQMNARRPVFIVGTNSQEDVGHAWVCEGYLNKKYEGVISMVPAPQFADGDEFYMDYAVNVNPPSEEQVGEFYYMNMGWGGLNNGWYRANTYNASNPSDSYMENQQMMTVVPN